MFSTLNDLVLLFAEVMAHPAALDLNLLQIDDFRCRLVGLRCGGCRAGRCGRLLLIGISLGLRRALLVLVRYSHVLPQTVFVLECLFAVFTLPRGL